MNQLRAPKITFRGQQFVPNLYWFTPALVLSIATGYSSADIAIDNPSTYVRLACGAILPLALATSLATFELLRTTVRRRYGPPGKSVRILYPTGSVESAYLHHASPGDEFRQETLPLLALAPAAILLLAIAALANAGEIVEYALIAAAAAAGGVALLNLLPAMPFAGGHILRSIFWFLQDDYSSGTRVAFYYSLLVASIGLGAGGFLLVVNPEQFLPGLWSLLIGLLVLFDARRELLRSYLITRAGSVLACDAVAGLNPTVRASAPLVEAIDILLEQKANGPGLVRDRNVYTGALSLESLRGVPRSRWSEVSAGDIATPLERLPDTEAGASLLDVLRFATEHSELPAIVRDEKGRVCGLLDATMDPRMLLRRGIARDVRLASPAQ